MSEQRQSAGLVAQVVAGVLIGAVEALIAISLAALVFGGRLIDKLPDGIALYLGAAAVTLGISAWRMGPRRVIGGLQEAAAAVLAVVATTTALATFGSTDRAFVTVIAVSLVVTLLCGGIFFALGTLRRGNLIRFVPYPVLGGFLAGIGWLFLKSGLYVSAGVLPDITPFGDLIQAPVLQLWGPAFAFGVILLVATRLVKHPLVIPVAIGIGLVLFAVGMLVTGSTIESARGGGWLLLGPFDAVEPWQPWSLRAFTQADWLAVLSQWAGILVAVFVAVIAMLFHVSGSEVVLKSDLDSNQELRDAGLLNFASGAVGGIPGYHALSLTALADRMSVNARTAGLIAALIPLGVVVFGASVVELIPRAIVGGMLVFLGLAFIVEWVWDKRKILPRLEYAIVLLILAAIIVRGFLPGIVVGLVLAVVLFAISYGRIELVREVEFGQTYHSNVDRPAAERTALQAMADRVEILRLHGFVFFGTASGLLERIRRRVEDSAPRFLVVDLRRVSGVDSSAVVSFVKVMGLAQAKGFEIVFTGASDPVRAQLERGGVVELDGVIAFESDLDRGLQRAEDVLLAGEAVSVASAVGQTDGLAGMPRGLRPYLLREELAAGTVLIRRNDASADVFVLESGRLVVQVDTADGSTMRLRTIRPGVVVGEVAMYSGAPRTADVVAETPAVVLRLGGAELERLEASEPELAADVHRWLATTLSERLSDTMRAYDALMD